MSIKLKLKFGDLEFECEGDASFIKNDIPKMIEAISKISTAAPNPDGSIRRVSGGGGGEEKGKLGVTTKSLALALGTKKGPDLLKIALGYLHIEQGKETATRAEILKEMKTVSTVYKQSMERNFPRTVNALMTDQQINEPSQGQYVLSDAELAIIRAGIRK